MNRFAVRNGLYDNSDIVNQGSNVYDSRTMDSSKSGESGTEEMQPCFQSHHLLKDSRFFTLQKNESDN